MEHPGARGPASRTHTVLNQPAPLLNYNLYTTDPVLQAAVARGGAGAWEEEITRFGELLGTEAMQEAAVLANRHSPVFSSHDRSGYRVDRVDFHPAWHTLMAASVEAGIHGAPWADARPGAHVARAAKFYLSAQNEAGHVCPMSMTCAAVPVLRREPALAAVWEPGLTSRRYDPRFVPADQKAGLIFGMAMTEKQGGSDVRANTTRAIPQEDGSWRLIGHKWFCSHPMGDGFLVLAQAPNGLTCFLLPRFQPDGTLNRMLVQRLKDKLGNRSNASSEVEYDEAFAWRLGEEGRGVATIIEMANYTRLDCVLGSAAGMRQALVQALHHTRHRSAFGKRLSEQPAMQSVLADLALEVEASTTLAFWLAGAFEQGLDSPEQAVLRRVVTPIAKYMVCRRQVGVVAEALECLGGSGYVEDFPMARMFREAPLNGLWEGSGNVMCLDLLRSLRHQDARDLLSSTLQVSLGAHPVLDAFLRQIPDRMRTVTEGSVRSLMERLALALQGALLAQTAPGAVLDAFCHARLGEDRGLALGALPAQVDRAALLARAGG